MKKHLKAAILGTGFMGQQHGRRLASIDGVSVTAICDTNIESATKLKESLKCDAALFDTFESMLATAAIDVLYVCLPPCVHCGQVEQAAAKGIHLFLEKPIAPTVEHAQRMVEAIEKAGVVSQVGFHMRFRKGVRKLKELIESNAAGMPAAFTGRYWCNMLGSAWWRDVSRSGGQVFEQVIHVYDLATYLLGKPVAVSAFMDNLCHTGVHDYSIEDTSVASIRFASGAMATINGSNCALPERFIGDWQVVCEKAVLDYRSPGDWRVSDTSVVTVHGGGTVRNEQFTEDGDPYGEEDIAFFNAIRTGGAATAPARHGLDAIRLVSAAIESARNGGNLVRM